MSVILLCGSDKTGKTTIANLLVDKHAFICKKFSAPKKGENMFKSYLKALKNVKGDTVFDRFHFCDMAYGPIYRGHSDIGKNEQKIIEQELLKLNTVVIYCHDEVKRIAIRFKRDNETFAKTKDIARIIKGYKKALSTSVLPIVRHRMQGKTDLTKGDKLKKLVKSLKQYETIKD